MPYKAEDQGGEAPRGVPADTKGHELLKEADALKKGSIFQVGSTVNADHKNPSSPNTKNKGDRDWVG